MGTDDLFKKRRAGLKERKREQFTPKPDSFLIVSEGQKTEPLYFDGLANYINGKYGKGIDVRKPIIQTRGEGKCTVSLVEEADKIQSRANIVYNQIWVIFDKDDFLDFDEAIDLALKKGFHVGWSNQCFEYWIFLHFNYSDAALDRNEWIKKLSEVFRKNGIDPQGYKKNDSQIFEIATKYGSLKAAVSNAKRIEKQYQSGTKPSLCDPCTTVQDLIFELKPWLSGLL